MSDQDNRLLITVAVLGGTGKEGAGLALRWAQSGYKVIIGSRNAERAAEAAAELNDNLGADYISGAENSDAAAQANLVVLSVPYSAQKDILESVRDQLTGKVLVDITIPLDPSNVRQVNIPAGTSAAMEAQEFLGDDVHVVGAFHNVSAGMIKDPNAFVDCDVLVFGDNDEAKDEVIQLAQAAGMRGIDAGPLANSVAAEAMTSVLLYINKKYGVHHAGIRITRLA